jgi:hypothetical protein
MLLATLQTHSSDDHARRIEICNPMLTYWAWYRVHGLPIMDKAKQPEPIKSEPKESTASRIERREAEIALAMKQEVERRAAVVKNMHRLRALRLSQTPKASA